MTNRNDPIRTEDFTDGLDAIRREFDQRNVKPTSRKTSPVPKGIDVEIPIRSTMDTRAADTPKVVPLSTGEQQAAIAETIRRAEAVRHHESPKTGVAKAQADIRSNPPAIDGGLRDQLDKVTARQAVINKKKNLKPARKLPSIWMRAPKTRGLTILLLATLLYLVVEFAFSARLIDVLGRTSTKEEIKEIEHWGRLISGFAVALMFWPRCFAKTRTYFSAFFRICIVSSIIIFFVYHAEKKFIEAMVFSSSQEERAAAMQGSLLRAGLSSGIIGEESLGGLWSDENKKSLAAKAFIGVVAALGSSSESAIKATQDIAPDVVRGVLDKQGGGVQPAYDNFIESQKPIKDKYNAYQKASQQIASSQGNVEQEAEKAWQDYLNTLEKRSRKYGRNYPDLNASIPRAAPARMDGAIRQQLQKKGIPVSSSWNTGDRYGFKDAYRKAHQQRLDRTVKSKLGGMKLGLSLSAFASQSNVQREWKARLGYHNFTGQLPIGKTSLKTFESSIYNPILNNKTKTELGNYQAKSSEFGKFGRLSDEGEDAFEAMFAPVVALILSMAGALTHMGKVAFLMLQRGPGIALKGGAKAKSLVILIWIVGAFALAPALISTPITSHQTYIDWQSSIAKNDEGLLINIKNQLLARGLDGVIRLQTQGYPAFDMARNTLQSTISGLDGFISKTVAKSQIN